jgi:hypothetical protein
MGHLKSNIKIKLFKRNINWEKINNFFEAEND